MIVLQKVIARAKKQFFSSCNFNKVQHWLLSLFGQKYDHVYDTNTLTLNFDIIHIKSPVLPRHSTPINQ
jgi:hypothetical protein